MSQESVKKKVEIKTENYICPNCGGSIKHDIHRNQFLCSFCGYEASIENFVDSIKEYDFNEYEARESSVQPFQGLAAVSCKNCGAEIVFEEQETATVCPMCSSTQVATVKQHSAIPPEGIIPFKIDKQSANLKFRKWVKSRWFAPNRFKTSYQEGGLSGNYIPFWTYDAEVTASYTGQGGKRRTAKGEDGKEKTVVDWFPTNGIVSESFDDIQVCASNKKGNEVISMVLPYDTVKQLKPYAPAYLSGHKAELYSIKATVGFETAKGIMKSKINTLAMNEIRKTYDEARIQTLTPKYSNVTYKHVLLPVWSSVFSYGGKLYRYAVNGESGKVSGERPYSSVKIAMLVLFLLAVLVAFFVLTK